VTPRRTLTALAACTGAALAVPATASAQIIEVGSAVSATPSCPNRPCLAVSRTTGYQAGVDSKGGLWNVPANGRIVAWTIRLGKPGPKQIAFFDDRLGGPATAQLTVLQTGPKRRHRTVGQGEVQRLEPFFGTTAQFPLERSIAVRKGWLVALTVPTWAPALAVGMSNHTTWRASRSRGHCEDTQLQTAQVRFNQLAQYACLYRTAQLTFSATLVTDPVPAPTATPKSKPKPPASG
jgi:hypothetical protein